MSGVEFAASVAGLASLGIQVCQGLLAYYDGFKDYHADISSTYRNIASMNDVFASLKSLLEDTSLSSKNRAHVQSGILACEATLHKVHGKLKKLRTHDEPSGAKQKAWADLQRLFYPFRASTLAKLKELMEELRGNLSMAIHVLQLDVAVITSHKLDDLFIQGQGISKKLGSIEAQGNAADHKLDTIATSHRDYQKRMILRADAHAAENRRRWDALTHQVNSNSEQMGHIQFRDIILWLSRANMSSSHDAATSKHVHGTGQWLLDLSEYKLWKSSEETVLWLSGKAGCGKTILCSTVIDELTSTLCVGQGDEIRLAYYYFSFNNPEYHGLQSFLASIAAQVCHLAPVSTRARSMYASQQGSIGKASTRQAQELIDLALRHVRLFVVVDALDEIPEQDNKRQEILDWIEQAANARKKIKIFAVSRVSGDIQSAMIASRALHINIGGSGCDADIKKYIVEELRLDRRFEGLSDHLKERIEQELSSKADGMFRWAYCQLESLKRLKSKRPAYIEQTLKGLPLTLDETYERMLAQIDPMFRVEASKALRWLSFAVTPLTMAQLNEACLIDLDDDELVQVENRVPCQELLEILGSLILIEGYPVTRLYSHDDPDGRYWFHDGLRVRLSHFSVQEYLVCNRIKESKLSQFALQPDDGRTVLLRYTIAYLECCVQAMQDVMPESLDSPFRPTLGRQALFYGRYPLFRYMAFALATYLSTDDETIVQQAMPLLRAGGFVHLFENLNIASSLSRYWDRTCRDYKTTQAYEADSLVTRMSLDFRPRGWLGAAYAASRGLTATLKAFLDEGVDVNGYWGHYLPLLNYACGAPNPFWTHTSSGGSEACVELLIQAGADMDSKASVDMNSGVGDNCTALEVAYTCSLPIMRRLIENGADFEYLTRMGAPPLLVEFAEKRNIEGILLLLEHHADVNAGPPKYNTALWAAASQGDTALVAILLEAGADPDLRIWSSTTPLIEACLQGHSEVIELLVHGKADLDAIGGRDGSALNTAIRQDDDPTVQLLLQHGAKPTLAVGDQLAYAARPLLPPIMTAIFQNKSDLVTRLLDLGASPTTLMLDHWGGTRDISALWPLAAAVGVASIEISRILIDRGAHVDFRTHKGSAIEAAMRGRVKEVKSSRWSELWDMIPAQKGEGVDLAKVDELIAMLFDAAATERRANGGAAKYLEDIDLPSKSRARPFKTAERKDTANGEKAKYLEDAELDPKAMTRPRVKDLPAISLNRDGRVAGKEAAHSPQRKYGYPGWANLPQDLAYAIFECGAAAHDERTDLPLCGHYVSLRAVDAAPSQEPYPEDSSDSGSSSGESSQEMSEAESEYAASDRDMSDADSFREAAEREVDDVGLSLGSFEPDTDDASSRAVWEGYERGSRDSELDSLLSEVDMDDTSLQAVDEDSDHGTGDTELELYPSRRSRENLQSRVDISRDESEYWA